MLFYNFRKLLVFLIFNSEKPACKILNIFVYYTEWLVFRGQIFISYQTLSNACTILKNELNLKLNNWRFRIITMFQINKAWKELVPLVD